MSGLSDYYLRISPRRVREKMDPDREMLRRLRKEEKQMTEPMTDFQVQSKFNMHLGSHYDDVSLCGRFYPPGFALEKLDPRFYEQRFDEWKINMQNDGRLIRKDGEWFWVEPDEEKVMKTPARLDDAEN